MLSTFIEFGKVLKPKFGRLAIAFVFLFLLSQAILPSSISTMENRIRFALAVPVAFIGGISMAGAIWQARRLCKK